jgi:DNA-binding transcriptional regulator YdaS (Cro superfamily)
MTDLPEQWATPALALADAISRAGSQEKLAAICGCTQGAICHMTKKDQPQLSAQFVLTVAQKLGIPPHALRPDLYHPPEVMARLGAAAA